MSSIDKVTHYTQKFLSMCAFVKSAFSPLCHFCYAHNKAKEKNTNTTPSLVTILLNSLDTAFIPSTWKHTRVSASVGTWPLRPNQTSVGSQRRTIHQTSQNYKKMLLLLIYGKKKFKKETNFHLQEKMKHRCTLAIVSEEFHPGNTSIVPNRSERVVRAWKCLLNPRKWTETLSLRSLRHICSHRHGACRSASWITSTHSRWR